MAKYLYGDVMKTTVVIKDEIYRKLVNEAVKKYGNTKSISKLLNEILKEALRGK
jgi:predicted CopG family antitoxin